MVGIPVGSGVGAVGRFVGCKVGSLLFVDHGTRDLSIYIRDAVFVKLSIPRRRILFLPHGLDPE